MPNCIQILHTILYIGFAKDNSGNYILSQISILMFSSAEYIHNNVE